MLSKYNENEEIKAFVDKYRAKEKVSLEEALSHRVVIEYAKYIIERNGDETKLRNMWGSAGEPQENVRGE